MSRLLIDNLFGVLSQLRARQSLLRARWLFWVCPVLVCLLLFATYDPHRLGGMETPFWPPVYPPAPETRLALPSPVPPAQTVRDLTGFQSLSLTGFLSSWASPTAQLDLSDALEADRDGLFQKLPAAAAAGFGRNTFWLRADVQAAEGGEGDWIVKVDVPHLDTVLLFQVLETEPAPSAVLRTRLGTLVSPEERAITHRTSTFPLHLAAGERRTLYFAISSETSRAVRVEFWRPRALLLQDVYDTLLFGACFGTMVAVIVFLWAVTATTGEKILATLSLYFVPPLISGFYVEGFLPLLFLQGHSLAVRLFPPVLNTVLFAGLTYSMCRMLDMKTRYPRSDAFFRGITVSFFLLGALGIAYSNIMIAPLAYQMVLIPLLVLPVYALILWRRYRDIGAGILLMSSALHGLASTPLLLRNMGLIPPYPYLSHFQQSGIALQSIIVTYVLSQSVRRAHQDKVRAQHDLVEGLRRSEADLEQHVALRTQDLAAANSQLAREITERQALEESLRHAYQRTEQSLVVEQTARKEQRNFLAMLSHEFRVPLAIIDAASHVLSLLLPPTAEEPQQEIEKIRRAVPRMRNIINTCLADDWLETAVMSPRCEPLDLVWCVEDICHEKNSLCTPPRLHTELPENAPCLADETLITIVVSNLLDNALKYSPAPHPVLVHLWQEAEALILTVTDSGAGIPEQERSAIFDKFYRSPTVGRVSGAGLGLYVVRKIVELHSGRIEVLPNPCGGSIFRLTLPALPPPSPVEPLLS